MLLLHRAAASGMQGVSAGGGVVMPQRRARLQGCGGDARNMEIHLDHMIGSGEGAVGRLRIAEHGVDQHIIRRLVPYRRRAGGASGPRVGHPRQRLIIDDNGFRGVERLRLALRHHHGDALADVAGLVGRQQMMRTDEDLGPAGPGQLEVGPGRGQRAVRNWRETVGEAIRAGEYSEHAGHGAGGSRVDAQDAGVRVRRADHRRMGLALDGKIVGETALAGHQALIFPPAQRLADGTEWHPQGFIDPFVHARPS